MVKHELSTVLVKEHLRFNEAHDHMFQQINYNDDAHIYVYQLIYYEIIYAHPRGQNDVNLCIICIYRDSDHGPQLP